MPSAPRRLDALEDRVAALRVDADGRLVEDQQRRPVQQADADVQPALHAAGVLLGLVLGPVGQADDVEHLVDARFAPAPAQPVEPARRSAGSRGRSGRGRWRAPAARSRSPPWPRRCAWSSAGRRRRPRPRRLRAGRRSSRSSSSCRPRWARAARRSRPRSISKLTPSTATISPKRLCRPRHSRTRSLTSSFRRFGGDRREGRLRR